MKKIVLAALAAFVVVFGFEFLWHGFLMKGMYEATMSVWRPGLECNILVMLASQFLFALALAVGYSCLAKHLQCKQD